MLSSRSLNYKTNPFDVMILIFVNFGLKFWTADLTLGKAASWKTKALLPNVNLI